jgi:hypothetical protein
VLSTEYLILTPLGSFTMLTDRLDSPDAAIATVAGMSLREYYAGIALASMASSLGNSGPSAAKTNIWKPEHVADKAVQLADAMLQRLARP